jgi:hypothetical protein
MVAIAIAVAGAHIPVAGENTTHDGGCVREERGQGTKDQRRERRDVE